MYREKLVGIVTRTDLLRALINAAKPRHRRADDGTIRGQLLSTSRSRSGLRSVLLTVEVRNGNVTFSGFITDERERRALCTAAENIPGVKRVEDQLAWLVPGTGVMVAPVVITGSGK